MATRTESLGWQRRAVAINIPAVNCRLRALMFVLCLLWQPLSALLPSALDDRADAIGHAVVHDTAVGHHHHEDASLHLGEGDEAPHQHVLDGGQPPALFVTLAGIASTVRALTIPVEEPSQPESAVLEGPLRPPRAARA